MSTQETGPEPLWRPGPAAEGSRISGFQRFLAASRGLTFPDYDALWRWSVEELEDFWAAVWEHFALDRVSRFDAVLDGEAMPGARWFPGAELNFATYLLGQGSAEDAVIVRQLRDAGAPPPGAPLQER